MHNLPVRNPAPSEFGHVPQNAVFNAADDFANGIIFLLYRVYLIDNGLIALSQYISPELEGGRELS